MCANVIISNTFSVTASDAKYRGFIADKFAKFVIPGVYPKIFNTGGLSENFDIRGVYRPKSAIPGVYRILP